ncbi:MAG TPA: electron transport complex subunit RsxC [Firmicutes bacterium]|nr:electron transport complex subunit RsxC [Bacillota bacterium]
MVKTFPRGGGDIPHRKEATEKKPIVVLDAPAQVVIPLQQHIGVPCESLVGVGDRVKLGQKIGKATRYVCAPIHSSVSGTVKAVEERPLLDGRQVLSVIIENDGRDEPAELQASPSIEKMSPKAIRRVVQEAGIVGMGGAGFPTHIKLDPPLPIDTVLINGAECEPYLTCDHRLMLEKAPAVISGLLALIKAGGAKRGIICIEANKPDAIEVMQEAVRGYDNLSVEVLKVRYPQGAEKQLIKAILNEEVSSGCLPCECRCIVQNVHTAVAVHEALQGKPSYERVLTVSGGAVLDPRNILARIGTPIAEVLEFCGGTVGEPAAIIGGGPMTGPRVVELQGPVVKTLSGVLALRADEAGFDENRPCLRCSRCVEVCPMGLTPSLLGDLSAKGYYGRAEKLGLMECIECGICSYACPSKRALTTWIKEGKAGLAAEMAKEKVG